MRTFDVNSNKKSPLPEVSNGKKAPEAKPDRAHRPNSSAFRNFMASGWDTTNIPTMRKAEVATYAANRRFQLSRKFCGDYILIPAGTLKQRSNDTDYRFRPHSAFAYYTGLGLDYLPEAVLVLEPVSDEPDDDGNPRNDGNNHKSTLYFRSLAGRDDAEFYSDTRYGEFWVGPRPTLAQLRQQLGIDTAHIQQFAKLPGNVDLKKKVRIIREADPNLTTLVDELRHEKISQKSMIGDDSQLEEFVSEARLIKDEWEVAKLNDAIKATVAGFEDIVREIPRALAHEQGERVVEGTFSARAREEGNGLGYDVIAASGNNATILHWTRNNGKMKTSDLLLIDAGVEDDSLYTADITRTLPLNGKYSPLQRRVYQAVLEAADTAFKAALPGRRFREVHDAAMEVLVTYLDSWGLLPVPATVSLSSEGQHHRRWMPHGTSHHLGIDVHDCAKARSELYMEGEIRPGMIFTIEPGLYFKEDDLFVPKEYRGIGIRIEDDILISSDGPINLSSALPRQADDIEAWMNGIQKRGQRTFPGH